MKDGFGRNLKSKKGRYYCSSCGNITFHNGKGVCENAFLNKFKKVPMKAKLTRGLEKTKDFGMISKIELPNKSLIYITKKGWTLVTPKGVEVLIPYSEINLAIDETIAQGYVIKGEKKCKQN